MLAKLTPNTQIIGQNLIYFNRIDSSNDFAQRLIQRQQAIHGTLIITDFQTKGRGQGSHIWQSEAKKNLLCSLILLPDTSISDPFILNKALAIAIISTLSKYVDANQLKIKWPNDIYYQQSKLGGLLVENTFQGQGIKSSVMGFGINTHQHFQNTPFKAIALHSIALKPYSHEDIILSFLSAFEQLFHAILQSAFGDINKRFDQLLLGYQTSNTFNIEGQNISATIIGCDEHGRLILENKLGQQTLYLHGQITQNIHE